VLSPVSLESCFTDPRDTVDVRMKQGQIMSEAKQGQGRATLIAAPNIIGTGSGYVGASVLITTGVKACNASKTQEVQSTAFL